ncbi:MAG: hypothetical protein R6W69_13890 [Anaerolineales bacterium]
MPIGEGQGAGDALGFDFDAENAQARIQGPETGGGLKGGESLRAIAEVNEQGLGKIPVLAGEQAWVIFQEEVIDRAQAVAGRLAARDLTERLLGGVAEVFGVHEGRLYTVPPAVRATR